MACHDAYNLQVKNEEEISMVKTLLSQTNAQYYTLEFLQ